MIVEKIMLVVGKKDVETVRAHKQRPNRLSAMAT
jgi:hypothetical protein